MDGTVIGRLAERHRHQKLIAFPDRIEKEAPAGRKIHAIMDNESAHKHKAGTDWLKGHRRLTLHFTPLSRSWTNAVKGSWPAVVPGAVSTILSPFSSSDSGLNRASQREEGEAVQMDDQLGAANRRTPNGFK